MNRSSGGSRVFLCSLGHLACLVPLEQHLCVFFVIIESLTKISKNEVTDLRVVAGLAGVRLKR